MSLGAVIVAGRTNLDTSIRLGIGGIRAPELYSSDTAEPIGGGGTLCVCGAVIAMIAVNKSDSYDCPAQSYREQ